MLLFTLLGRMLKKKKSEQNEEEIVDQPKHVITEQYDDDPKVLPRQKSSFLLGNLFKQKPKTPDQTQKGL